MGHYLLNFLLTSGSVIGLLLLVYVYIRQNPRLGLGGGTSDINNAGSLQVESVLPLEPRKNLYVVRTGRERFLIATTIDKTEYLATLETMEPKAFETPASSETKMQAFSTQPPAAQVVSAGLACIGRFMKPLLSKALVTERK